MKANVLIGSTALALMLAGCSSAPKQHPRPVAPVLRPVKPTPAPVALPAQRTAEDWRDRERTPGTWRWRRNGALSQASYETSGGQQVFAMACDPAGRRIVLRTAPASIDFIEVATTSERRMVAVTPDASAIPPAAIAMLPAEDALLDAMAFSRGRFMVVNGAQGVLYLPSWPEISRVIEDCR